MFMDAIGSPQYRQLRLLMRIGNESKGRQHHPVRPVANDYPESTDHSGQSTARAAGLRVLPSGGRSTRGRDRPGGAGGRAGAEVYGLASRASGPGHQMTRPTSSASAGTSRDRTMNVSSSTPNATAN